MGDPAGIGGEVALKSLLSICKNSIPVLIGDKKHIDYLSEHFFGNRVLKFKKFKQGVSGDIELIDLGLIDNVRFGIIDATYGHASYQYIIEALKHIFSGDVSAIVTCPINKMSIRSAGIPFIGHTELLAHFAGVKDYVMMMANRKMRVSLATIHIPLRDVPGSLSVDKIFKCISITSRSLKAYFNIKKPRIKVCGLNPHAGEHGIMGDEEIVIHEAISMARALSIDVDGPFPADTLFHKVNCDAYIAMYHDQGLIPVKTTGFEKTVNITLGLPFIRTSPGHGTGYDIAGKSVADPSGLIEAYRLAEDMIN